MVYRGGGVVWGLRCFSVNGEEEGRGYGEGLDGCVR